MDWSAMFFQDWEGIVRTLIVGLLAYVMLVLFLRISGKRTLAKLNAFDLVVTVALGSTLSAILLQESIALAEGATALALLILAQFAVTYLSVRSSKFASAVRSEPALLAKDGSFCHGAMRRERITESEVLSSIRSQGGRGIDDAKTVILESDGGISVSLKAHGACQPSSLGSSPGPASPFRAAGGDNSAVRRKNAVAVKD